MDHYSVILTLACTHPSMSRCSLTAVERNLDRSFLILNINMISFE
jgi:hypothetical protein